MVEKANSTIPRETSSPPRGPSTVLKARAVRATPFTCPPEASAVPSTPEAQMHRPVTVQITVVSKNTPVMFTYPWRAGLSVAAEAAGMAAEPMPASWEKQPLAMPQRAAFRAEAVIVPAAPPAAAAGEKARRNISATAPGRADRCPSSTAVPASR